MRIYATVINSCEAFVGNRFFPHNDIFCLVRGQTGFNERF